MIKIDAQTGAASEAVGGCYRDQKCVNRPIDSFPMGDYSETQPLTRCVVPGGRRPGRTHGHIRAHRDRLSSE